MPKTFDSTKYQTEIEKQRDAAQARAEKKTEAVAKKQAAFDKAEKALAEAKAARDAELASAARADALLGRIKSLDESPEEAGAEENAADSPAFVDEPIG
jgi:membrane protein involved in colicin uptake